MGQTRVQYFSDTTDDWVDVVGRPWQVNPVTYWVLPIGTAGNGSEIRAFDLPEAITTDRLRVLIEQGSEEGWSYLDEIEAYEPEATCTQANLALPSNGGVAGASSVIVSGNPAAAVNNGQRETGFTGGYWHDATHEQWPDWVGVTWPEPVAITRLVAPGRGEPAWLPDRLPHAPAGSRPALGHRAGRLGRHPRGVGSAESDRRLGDAAQSRRRQRDPGVRLPSGHDDPRTGTR